MGTKWELTCGGREDHNSEPVSLASLLPPLLFVHFTRLANILVTAYYFTLSLTQQSVARSGNPSAHATCSQNCSRGHLEATSHAGRRKQNNSTIWFLGEKSESLGRTFTLTYFLHSVVLAQTTAVYKVGRLKRDHFHNGLSSAGSPSALPARKRLPCYNLGESWSLSKQTADLELRLGNLFETSQHRCCLPLISAESSVRLSDLSRNFSEPTVLQRASAVTSFAQCSPNTMKMCRVLLPDKNDAFKSADWKLEQHLVSLPTVCF